MKHATSLVVLCIVLTPTVLWLRTDVVKARATEPITELVRLSRCFADGELNERFGALRLQGSELTKAFRSLLAKARTSPECRTTMIQELIKGMEQARKTLDNTYDDYRFFDNGASLLAELKATEALDMLVANIDVNDKYGSGLDDFPALVAILKIGRPAIPKLRTLLNNDSEPGRRKFAALATAYIGGVQAKRALAAALPHETDPCVKKFLAVSLRAFDNKERPNRVSSALNGQWLRAFYCN